MTTLHKVALVVIAGGSFLVGLWAQVLPRSFYDDFPGFGRVWVAVDGPYNQHLVRDVGGLNLALAFVALYALVSASIAVARAAGGAALIFGLPHFLYHATHLHPFDTTDKVALLVPLAVAVLAAVLALAAPQAKPSPKTSTGSPAPPAR